MLNISMVFSKAMIPILSAKPVLPFLLCEHYRYGAISSHGETMVLQVFAELLKPWQFVVQEKIDHILIIEDFRERFCLLVGSSSDIDTKVFRIYSHLGTSLNLLLYISQRYLSNNYKNEIEQNFT